MPVRAWPRCHCIILGFRESDRFAADVAWLVLITDIFGVVLRWCWLQSVSWVILIESFGLLVKRANTTPCVLRIIHCIKTSSLNDFFTHFRGHISKLCLLEVFVRRGHFALLLNIGKHSLALMRDCVGWHFLLYQLYLLRLSELVLWVFLGKSISFWFFLSTE